MNKKLIAVISLFIILAFIGYIIYDTITSGTDSKTESVISKEILPEDQWIITEEMVSVDGPLISVAVGQDGNIYLGGESYVTCLNQVLSKLWSIKTEGKITALSISGDTVFAASVESITLISTTGKLLNEWGPYEANSIITSISANKKYVAFADAGNKRVFVLKKDGEVYSMMGQADNKFIIPSPYFDVALYGEKTLYIANTGNRRVETWTTEGKLLQFFGEPGSAPDAFCGCCNPAHFAVVPQGFVTAEKGINRIKILSPEGEFLEYVSSKNSFSPPMPLDVASADGKTIYAANHHDSKLYVFKRK